MTWDETYIEIFNWGFMLKDMPSVNTQQLMQQTNQTPEQIVKSMLQSGQISQDQFNRAVQMANAITGKKF